MTTCAVGRAKSRDCQRSAAFQQKHHIASKLGSNARLTRLHSSSFLTAILPVRRTAMPRHTCRSMAFLVKTATNHQHCIYDLSKRWLTTFGDDRRRFTDIVGLCFLQKRVTPVNGARLCGGAPTGANRPNTINTLEGRIASQKLVHFHPRLFVVYPRK